MLQYFWPHIILDTCTQYTFNIFCKKNTTPIRSTRTEETHHPGADPGFQVRGGGGGEGGALKKIAPSEGRRENFGEFRVKNHDFTPKNHIFSNFRGVGGGGARAGCAPSPLDPPLPSDFTENVS